MSDAARRLLAVGVVALTVVVGVVWLVSRAADDEEPPLARLRCLDAYHRPLERQPTQHTLAVGVDVVGPAPSYRVVVELDGRSASTDAPTSVVPVLVPTTGQVVVIEAVRVVPLTGDDDVEPIDVTEQVLGGPGRDVVLPDAGGPVDPALDPCQPPPSIDPGYPFAAPTPPFGGGPSVEPSVADEAAAVVAALHEGDPGRAMGLLHPASLAGYGEEICRAHVDTAVPAMPALETQAVSAVSGYRFQRPGGEDQLDDVVVVEVLAEGVPWRFNLARHEGQLRWLSWCGN